MCGGRAHVPSNSAVEGGEEESGEAGLDVGDADGVEAELPKAGKVAAAFRHPGGRQASDPALLPGADREDRPLRAEVRPLTARLHLEEDEGRAVEADDVDLPEAGAGAPLDDLPEGGGEAGDQNSFTPARETRDATFTLIKTPYGWKLQEFAWQMTLPQPALAQISGREWVKGDREKFQQATGQKP